MSRRIEKVVFPLPLDTHFHEIIDVRSPLEFAEDHVDGAINLPVLNDEERARVGTIFKQTSPFEARKIGAALISKNIAMHLEAHFSAKGKDYHPLVYCWRGGQRSGSLATVLNAIGWAADVIDGGYRTYRHHVIESLRAKSELLPFVVLNGYTGAGKTLLLRSLEKSGQQVLDLEGLALHRGSVFGDDPGSPQPAQKQFESRIFESLSRLDASRPVFVEAESVRIGRLNLPNPLWQRMKNAPVIEIVSPLASRAAYIIGDYADWLDDTERIGRTIDRLKGFHADRILAEWKSLSMRRDWEVLVTSLLAAHYDKRYSVGGSGHFNMPFTSVELPRHDEVSVAQCAGLLLERVEGLMPVPLIY